MGLLLMLSLSFGYKHRPSNEIAITRIVVEIVFAPESSIHFQIIAKCGRTAKLLYFILNKCGVKLFQIVSASFQWKQLDTCLIISLHAVSMNILNWLSNMTLKF